MFDIVEPYFPGLGRMPPSVASTLCGGSWISVGHGQVVEPVSLVLHALASGSVHIVDYRLNV